MKNAFCTIVTPDYLPYAVALFRSVETFGSFGYYVLVTDTEGPLPASPSPGIHLISTREVCTDGIGKAIYEKYHATKKDEFRWSMKPVLMQYVLESKGAEKVLCIDCDIHFYSDPAFLFDYLDRYNFIVNPHWRSSDPDVDTAQYRLLYSQGLYNGGFTAANKKGLPILSWWSKACHRNCAKHEYAGMYVDQGHLTLIPVYFEDVLILRHRGCDLAAWNLPECRRVKVGNDVLINGEYPVVFIHFTTSTVFFILENKDPLLAPHLARYFEAIEQAGIGKSMLNFYKGKLAAHHERSAKLHRRNRIRSVFRRLLGR